MPRSEGSFVQPFIGGIPCDRDIDWTTQCVEERKGDRLRGRFSAIAQFDVRTHLEFDAEFIFEHKVPCVWDQNSSETVPHHTGRHLPCKPFSSLRHCVEGPGVRVALLPASIMLEPQQVSGFVGNDFRQLRRVTVHRAMTG